MGTQHNLFGFFYLIIFPSLVLLECILNDTSQTLQENLTVTENTVANFSCSLTAKTTQLSSGSEFVLEIKLCDNKTTHNVCKCRCLNDKTDRCKSLVNFSNCHANNSEIFLSLLVKRTYSDITWEIFEQENAPIVLRRTAIQVTYPPIIASLLVNERKVDERQIINEHGRVDVDCFFSNGNPPVDVELQAAVEGGTIQNVSRAAQGHLALTLGDLRCQDVWPTVSCKAPGSEKNQYVFILIRCPPKFSTPTAEVVDLSRIRDNSLRISGIISHTENIVECWMRSMSLEEEEKRMKCEFSGKAPHFEMTVYLGKESWVGNWTLFVRNEVGDASKIFLFTNVALNDPSRRSDLQDWEPKLLIAVGCLVFVALSTAAVVLVCVGKLCKTRASGEGSHRSLGTSTTGNDLEVSRDGSRGNERNRGTDATITAENEVQGSAWRCRNADGLIYGQLDFADRISSDVIIGSFPETQYADIHFAASRTAPSSE